MHSFFVLLVGSDPLKDNLKQLGDNVSKVQGSAGYLPFKEGIFDEESSKK